MKRILPAFAAVFLSVSPASAQPAEPPSPAQDVATLRTCALAAGVTDLDRLEACEKPILRSCANDYAACYGRLLTAWDQLLAASFGELTRGGVLARRDARNLQSAQRAWGKFRDEDCEFYAGVWPGARPPGQLAACRHRETRERATVLTMRLEAAKKLRRQVADSAN